MVHYSLLRRQNRFSPAVGVCPIYRLTCPYYRMNPSGRAVQIHYLLLYALRNRGQATSYTGCFHTLLASPLRCHRCLPGLHSGKLSAAESTSPANATKWWDQHEPPPYNETQTGRIRHCVCILLTQSFHSSRRGGWPKRPTALSLPRTAAMTAVLFSRARPKPPGASSRLKPRNSASKSAQSTVNSSWAHEVGRADSFTGRRLLLRVVRVERSRWAGTGNSAWTGRPCIACFLVRWDSSVSP